MPTPRKRGSAAVSKTGLVDRVVSASFERLSARRCRTDASKESLCSGDELPFGRGERLASECVSFAPHFHEFSGL